MTGIRRVVLIGFMAAGKSTVGRLLADRLGWRFIDLDERIEAIAGRSVADIFARDGESAFRALEEQATHTLVTEGDVVIAPGGGWVTSPALLDALRPGSLVVWLRISPREAVRRALAEQRPRPLLEGGDPLSRAEMLLAERTRYYEAADIAVDAEGRDPDDVAEVILKHLRS